MYKILIIEDDEDIILLERDYLEMHGFEVDTVSDGNLAVNKILKSSYDLIILDVMLPSKSGYDICKEIRNKVEIPILFVTAKDSPVDKLKGLNLGADDYITKPFHLEELVSRVKVHINRHYRLLNLKNNEDESITIKNVKIIPKSWKVFLDNKELNMPKREFEILNFLAQNPNIVFSKEEIFEKIWGFDFINDNSTVTVHIKRIREKIEEDTHNPKIIETIWGIGYRLNL